MICLWLNHLNNFKLISSFFKQNCQNSRFQKKSTWRILNFHHINQDYIMNRQCLLFFLLMDYSENKWCMRCRIISYHSSVIQQGEDWSIMNQDSCWFITFIIQSPIFRIAKFCLHWNFNSTKAPYFPTKITRYILVFI